MEETWRINIERTLSAHNEKLSQLDERTKRIEKLQSSLQDLTTSVAIMAEKMDYIRKDTTAIKSEVNALKEIPANRWASFTMIIITAITSAIVGALVRGLIG